MSYYSTELLDCSFKESVINFTLQNGNWTDCTINDSDLDLDLQFKPRKPDLTDLYERLENISSSLQEYNPLMFDARNTRQLSSSQKQWIKDRFLDQCKEEYETFVSHLRETNVNHLTLKAQVLNRLSEVSSWVPPTSKHERLKEEMLVSLNSLLESSRCREIKIEKRQSVYQWWAQEVLSLEAMKHNHIDAIKCLIDSQNETNEWIIALRDSLK